MRSLKSWFVKVFFSDKSVQKRYAATGADFGDAVSYIYMGECIGFEKMLDRWAFWEAEHARRGYRTLPIDDFIDCGGYGVGLPGLGQKRDAGEKPVLHAEIYRRRFLGKIPAVIDIRRMMQTGEPQAGTYLVPSTKDAGKK